MKAVIWIGIIIGLIAWLFITIRGTSAQSYATRDFVYQSTPPAPLTAGGTPMPQVSQQVAIPQSSYLYPQIPSSSFGSDAGEAAIRNAFIDLLNTYYRVVQDLNQRYGGSSQIYPPPAAPQLPLGPVQPLRQVNFMALPAAGIAPLNVNFVIRLLNFYSCDPVVVLFGDGTQMTLSPRNTACFLMTEQNFTAPKHYPLPGIYNAQLFVNGVLMSTIPVVVR